MQNKPNFSNNPMNISFCLTKNYKQKALLPAVAKQTQSKPIKPNFPKAKIKLNFYSTRNLEQLKFKGQTSLKVPGFSGRISSNYPFLRALEIRQIDETIDFYSGQQ
jgi:hypothetical protein